MDTGLRRACVMGHPVAHSRSPMIHDYWLKTLGIPGAYELKDLPPEEFPAFVAGLGSNGYVGGNVTVPHKEAAYRLVSRRDEAAEAVGAVNTLWVENGKLLGGNSDTHGFIANLDDRAPGWDVPGCRALVLGAGGAGRSAVYAFTMRMLVNDSCIRSVSSVSWLLSYDRSVKVFITTSAFLISMLRFVRFRSKTKFNRSR